MNVIVSSGHGVGAAIDRIGGYFVNQRTRQGILARQALGAADPTDAAHRDQLVSGMRAETRIDGSLGGAVVPTIWRALELMDLGHLGDQAGTVRVMGWVLSLQGKPGAYGEGCTDARHAHQVCEHFIGGFFAAASPTERVAPLTLPNGKTFRAEAAARFAVSCLALRAALRAKHESRPGVERHLMSLVRLQEQFTDWTGYFAPDITVAALHALAYAPPPHRDAMPLAAAAVAANQEDDGTWPNADLFHTLDALMAAGTPEARGAVRRAAPALLARQRDDGTFGAIARDERTLIGLRALLLARQEES